MLTSLRLPLSPPPKHSQPTNASPILRGRILLAEDGPDNQRLISHLLRRAGADVRIAPNGRIALEMIAEAERSRSAFDLLLTDMQMPEMDGYTLAKSLRAKNCSLPILALTAHALADDRDRCLESGCDDYASKPVDKHVLLALCAKWMSKHRSAEPSSSTP